PRGREELGEDLMNAVLGRNILHVGKFYSPHRGGIESHLQSLCGQLARHLRVRVLVWGDRIGREEIADDGFRVTKLGNWINFAGAPLAPGIFTEMRRSDADLVHVHWPNPVAALAYMMFARDKPLIISWHSDIVRQKRLGRAFAPLLRKFLECSRAIIVSSSSYAASSADLKPYLDRCRVVPYGIEPRRFARYDRGKVSAIRASHQGNIVLTVARLVYYKGLEHLIRAMREVAGTLVIVGDGPLRGQLETFAETCGVRDRVVFVGQVDDASPYYQACDVFVLPSIARNEAFGIVQLEAMAAGKPVVNTALPSSVPFVSIDGVTGLTVPPADAPALAGALNRLLCDLDLRAVYGHAGVRRVRDQFSVDLMTRRTLEVYRDVLSEERLADTVEEVGPEISQLSTAAV
ncbi:MAG TPA: glycosyltransferase, partial [Candidatus Binataceae bacterium]